MAGMTQPRVTQRRVDIDGYPTTCCRCHQPIVKKRHDSQQHYDHRTRTATSWHTTCTTFAAPADVKQRHPAPAATLGRGQRGVPSTTQHEQEFPMTTIEPEPTPQPDPTPDPQPDPDPDPDDEK